MLMDHAVEKLATLHKLWMDSGYAGRCTRYLRNELNLDAEVVRRPDCRFHGRWQQQDLPLPKAQPVFRVVKWRWVVERTFAWLGRARRLSKDYEGLIETATAWIWVAMVRVLISRLAESTDVTNI